MEQVVISTCARLADGNQSCLPASPSPTLPAPSLGPPVVPAFCLCANSWERTKHTHRAMRLRGGSGNQLSGNTYYIVTGWHINLHFTGVNVGGILTRTEWGQSSTGVCVCPWCGHNIAWWSVYDLVISFFFFLNQNLSSIESKCRWLANSTGHYTHAKKFRGTVEDHPGSVPTAYL